MTDPGSRPWLILSNVSLIKIPQDFLKEFITEFYKLQDPRIFGEQRFEEYRKGRWGSDEVGFSYTNSWCNETSAIDEKWVLSSVGIPDLDFVWQYEQPHWSAWASNPDTGMENQSLKVRFSSENMQQVFTEFFHKGTGQFPILIKEGAIQKTIKTTSKQAVLKSSATNKSSTSGLASLWSWFLWINVAFYVILLVVWIVSAITS